MQVNVGQRGIQAISANLGAKHIRMILALRASCDLRGCTWIQRNTGELLMFCHQKAEGTINQVILPGLPLFAMTKTIRFCQVLNAGLGTPTNVELGI